MVLASGQQEQALWKPGVFDYKHSKLVVGK